MMPRQRKRYTGHSGQKNKAVEVHIDSDQQQYQQAVSKKIRNHKMISFASEKNLYEKIKEIPEIRLTKEQMTSDPVELMTKLQHKYKEFGAVKIIACDQWQPPFNFKYSEKGITTRIQKIHKLKHGKAFDQRIEQYSIKSFTNYAENFEKTYKPKFEIKGKTKESQMENQYWNIIRGVESDDPKIQQKYKITIEYAADLPVHQYGSGFPMNSSSKSTDNNFDYALSPFNINNIYKSNSSILKITQNNNEKISGVTVPWVYMGMLFSSFCWHVEDLWLNSINYSHTGATKTWYIIPESDKDKFDAYILKKTGKREFLNSITFMIDPLQLIENGIKIYKAYQRPREYILTLFNAYHCGFSQGYNVGEAVNIGTIDSLAVMKKAQQVNSRDKHHKPPVLCYQWLVAANLNNPSLNKQLLQSEYSKIVASEFQRLKKFLEKGTIVKIQFVDPSLRYDRLSCSFCKYYQYLSVLRCVQCDKRFCLDHAEKCCGKGFVFMTRECDKQRKKTLQLVKESLK